MMKQSKHARRKREDNLLLLSFDLMFRVLIFFFFFLFSQGDSRESQSRCTSSRQSASRKTEKEHWVADKTSSRDGKEKVYSVFGGTKSKGKRNWKNIRSLLLLSLQTTVPFFVIHCGFSFDTLIVRTRLTKRDREMWRRWRWRLKRVLRNKDWR